MSIASEPVKECRLSADRPGKEPPETHKSQKGNGRVRTAQRPGGEAGSAAVGEPSTKTNKRLGEGADASVLRLTRGARRVAKSFAEHVRGRDLQTLPLRFNCCQIFQLCNPELFWFALFSPSSPHQTDNADTLKEKENGGRDERQPRRDPGSQAPIAHFNGNNKLLSQAIKSAFDPYLRAEGHCAI